MTKTPNMKKIKKDLGQSLSPNEKLTVLTREELDEIKRAANFVTDFEKQRNYEFEQEMKQNQIDKDLRKRKFMLELEEKNRAKTHALSEYEIEELKERNALRKRVDLIRLENMDEVKAMNKMVRTLLRVGALRSGGSGERPAGGGEEGEAGASGGVREARGLDDGGGTGQAGGGGRDGGCTAEG
jgi:hypothetical protein